MQVIWAEKALTSDGWARDVRIETDADGLILSVTPNVPREGQCVGILLPAPANLHSHAFQRAMAGMSEARGPKGSDNFWTWREIMYRFVDALTPDDVAAIAAFAQMEMLEAGYAACCEFHYLHHQKGGEPYDNPAEMAVAIGAGATVSGIGLTLLPVLYQYGGCDGRALTGGQMRFGNTLEQYAKLFEASEKMIGEAGNSARIGAAPHSLRATDKAGIALARQLAGDGPLHIHLAEQTGEVEELLEHRGARPVAWLYESFDVDARWCLIHLTHMTDEETRCVARSGAVAGLCPVTEANLGDGIFNGQIYIEAGGIFGIGSDSNIRISLSEELRALEYSQRLRERQRNVLASESASTGRVLFESAVRGGARAAGRKSGLIEVGYLADLMALDTAAPDLEGKTDDAWLDSYIFAGSDAMVSDVWSGGRHVVKAGAHFARDAITAQYRKTLAGLRQKL